MAIKTAKELYSIVDTSAFTRLKFESTSLNILMFNKNFYLNMKRPIFPIFIHANLNSSSPGRFQRKKNLLTF